jgi:hypothetical protein
VAFCEQVCWFRNWITYRDANHGTAVAEKIGGESLVEWVTRGVKCCRDGVFARVSRASLFGAESLVFALTIRKSINQETCRIPRHIPD